MRGALGGSMADEGSVRSGGCGEKPQIRDPPDHHNFWQANFNKSKNETHQNHPNLFKAYLKAYSTLKRSDLENAQSTSNILSRMIKIVFTTTGWYCMFLATGTVLERYCIVLDMGPGFCCEQSLQGRGFRCSDPVYQTKFLSRM